MRKANTDNLKQEYSRPSVAQTRMPHLPLAVFIGQVYMRKANQHTTFKTRTQ